MNKFSVIVPSYNNSDKIVRAVNSILSQTFDDLEVILVDDGSFDDTLSKMESIASGDSRVIVLHNEKNMGVGYSRNKGLDVASGNYVTFADSDDFLSLDTYDSVNDAINENDNPDIVRFKQNSFLDVANFRVNLSFFTNNVFNHVKGSIIPIKNPMYVSLESPGVCNKVFSRDLIGDTRFPHTKWEDYPFCTFLLGKANDVVFSNAGQYFYCHPVKCNNTTLGDINKAGIKLLDIYDCCDLLEKMYRESELFEKYEDAIRGSQKIQSLQRIRDVMFSKKYSYEEKRDYKFIS